MSLLRWVIARSVVGWVMIVLIVLGCAAPAGAPTGAPAPQQEAPAAEEAAQEPVILGAVFNQTGWMAAYDMPPRQGAFLAVDVVNEKGGILGRPVKLIELDGKTDPATVGNAAVQLIEQGAVAIIAPCDFDIGGPASQAAQEAGLVGISTCASSPLYGSKVLGDKQFTLSMWNNTMAAAAAEFGFNEKGWRKAAVVTDTSIEYSLSLGEFFIETWKALGGEVLLEDTYLQGDQDFSAQIQRIQSLADAPDVIYISSYAPDLSTILRQTRAAGIDTPIMGGDSYDDAELWAALGPDLGSEIYFITHAWMGPEAGEDVAEFLKLYVDKYGEPPAVGFTAMGWDTVMVLDQAMEHAGTTDGDAVARAMEELQFDLLSGNLDWTSAEEGHFPQKEAALVQLQAGEPSFLGWILPKYVPEP